MSLNAVREELQQAADVLSKVLADDALMQKVDAAAALMVDAINAGGKIISCGNGGSHADAMHFAEELSGRYRENRKALPAIAISDPTHISCVGNDYGYQFIFSRFIEGLGNKGDVLLGISTSGNSGNVLEALKAAKAKGMKTIVLSGNSGGKMAQSPELVDLEIRVPHTGYADRIQELHIKFIHIIIKLIEVKLGLA
jgi:D-sedoheptulose 7-phosphate isomerase